MQLSAINYCKLFEIICKLIICKLYAIKRAINIPQMSRDKEEKAAQISSTTQG